MVSDLTDNVEFAEMAFDCMDKSFKPIQITIFKDEDKKTFIASFNHCGGGTQARTMNKLLDNCKEVIWLVNDAMKDKAKKTSKKLIKEMKKRGK
jgi:hypothetical protein